MSAPIMWDKEKIYLCSQSLATANFAMECELSLLKQNRGSLHLYSIYVCLQKEGTRVLGLSKRKQGIGRVLDEQNMV